MKKILHVCIISVLQIVMARERTLFYAAISLDKQKLL